MIIESDSVSCVVRSPWKFQFYFNEVKSLASSLSVVFWHVLTDIIKVVKSAKDGVIR